MKTNFGTLMITAFSISMALAPAPAFAKDHHRNQHDDHWRGGAHDRNWDPAYNYRSGGRHGERRLGRNDDIYRGHDGRYYCRRGDGTTGLVIGAIGGGLLGNAIGGNALGTLLGAGGGAMLGRSIDRGNVRCL